MLELLLPDGVANGLLDLIVAFPFAQTSAEVCLVDREETGPQPSVGSQADAVAIGTEWFRNRADEANLPDAISEAEYPRCGVVFAGSSSIS